ncbi:hypothetical protein LCGC14_0716220 [marine sediment metagenome]|uniref:Uncharacterized protein n=1 Tax=marine sediment metagenome TaxID=412755 RepID=A0A0F9TL51_9ZZZZ
MDRLTVVLTDKADRAVVPTPIIMDLTNRVFDVKFATGLPGGFTSCTMSILLSVSRAYEWYERFLFFGITVYEADEPMWEGRISSISMRDYGVDVECEGYWASMADQALWSWWNDNDMGNWQIPSPGAGGVSDELTLSGAGNSDKFNILNSGALFHVSTKKNQSYLVGDKAVIYYRLPRVSTLTDKRLFQPMTIHSIRYTYGIDHIDINTCLPKVWSADYARGTWTQRHDPGVITPGTKAVNLVADGASAEAVAIGLECTTAYTEANEDNYRLLSIQDITIYAERDAFIDLSRRTTFKKVVGDLLNGQSPDTSGVTAHAKQISGDTLLIEDSDLEYSPLLFKGETIQAITTSMLNFGMATIENFLPNPSVENNLDGWWSKSVAATQVADPVFGDQAIEAASATGAGDGLVLLNLLGSGTIGTIAIENSYRFGVTAGKVFTFSVYLRRVTALTTYDLETRWFNNAGALISTSIQSVTLTTSFVRYFLEATAPAQAVAAELRIVATGSPAFDTFRADAAQFESGSLSDYLDVDQRSDLFWAGSPHASPTMRVSPASVGVYSRNRLKAQRRDESNIKWLLSVKEIEEGGIELQKSIQDYWVRVWARFENFVTAESNFTDMIEAPISQSLIYDQRDTVLELGRSIEGFARMSAQVHLEDTRLPRQSSQLRITGSISNLLGAREPLWRVRAGDVLYVYDLSPIPTLQPNPVTAKILDKLRVFLIKETEYDATSNELQIVPDAPPNMLDLFLMRLETTQLSAGKVSSSAGGGFPSGAYLSGF